MLQYLIKFSISLAVLYIFYRAVLRPLTFYQCNRFYLLCYSLLSFVIPFINITPWVAKEGEHNNQLVNIIPAIGNYTVAAGNQTIISSSFFLQRITLNQWVLLLFCAGVVAMIVRIVYLYLSLGRIRNQSILLNSSDNIHLYQTSEPVSPFSFGNAIYFNSSLHSEEELQRIIQHEFVHVKQKHSVDILVGELLCIVNWFNPFAWFIRHAIRQNLEFIADNDVIVNGLDKKEYQYLLLKVVGIPQYSIASNFNFSSLKKRIVMMNKMKSAKLHLTRFLFVLPSLAVLLLAFRNKMNQDNNETDKKVNIAGMVVDVATMQPIADAAIFCKEKNVSTFTDGNGYYFLQLPYENKPLQFTLLITKKGYSTWRQTENWGNFYGDRVLKRYGNSIELFGLGKGLKDGNGFSMLAGNVAEKEDLTFDTVLSSLDKFIKGKKNNKEFWGDTVPPPPPPVPATNLPAPTALPYNGGLPENVSGISHRTEIDLTTAVKEDLVTVTLKNGTKEIYNFYNAAEKAAYIKKYGELPKEVPPVKGVPPVAGIETVPPPVPVSAIADVNTIPAVSSNLPDDVESISISQNENKKKGTKTHTATVTLKNGTKEMYNLNDPKEKAAYTKKYGELPQDPPPVAPVPPVPAIDIVSAPVVVNDVPLNTDASQYHRPDNVVPHNIQIRSSTSNPPLYIIDGKEANAFNLNNN